MKVTIGDVSSSNHAVRLNDECVVKFYKLKKRNSGSHSKVYKKKSESEFHNDEMQKISFETTFKLNNADGKKEVISQVKNENNKSSASNSSKQDDVKLNVDVELDKEQLLLSEQNKIENKSDPAEINIITQGLNSNGVQDSRKDNQDPQTRKPICSVRGAVNIRRRNPPPVFLKFVVIFMLFMIFFLVYIISVLSVKIENDLNVVCQTNLTGLDTVNKLPAMASSLRFGNETNATISYSEI
ncbi:hypothetical protein TNCT_20471 [Trichonephila clavata]|uniref:Uncharacterized protein n=1 Tax=Trichonephila clavata TaxID=2740835 RepID=A0A8X6HN85_TRICU|nr:hypothetical protein TNCT_20471 [Trichonephila clavata]